jgi:hypothetical protein
MPDSVSDASPKTPSLVSLERQMERGSLFTHTALSESAARLEDVESVMYGLIDLLIAKGATTEDEVLVASTKVRRETEERGGTLSLGVALRVDTPNVGDDFVPVNCAERLPICKAACCRMAFALSSTEVETGTIKWDLGRPYYIRQEVNGCCTHLDPERKCCGIYQDRPAVCRRYSCAGDGRIWKDFDRMVLNEEWLAENVGPSRPRLVTALMHSPQRAGAS